MLNRLKILLIHWKAEEARSRLAELGRLGFEASHLGPEGMNDLRVPSAWRRDGWIIRSARSTRPGQASASAGDKLHLASEDSEAGFWSCRDWASVQTRTCRPRARRIGAANAWRHTSFCTLAGKGSAARSRRRASLALNMRNSSWFIVSTVSIVPTSRAAPG